MVKGKLYGVYEVKSKGPACSLCGFLSGGNCLNPLQPYNSDKLICEDYRNTGKNVVFRIKSSKYL
jgi:hypothetical protein